MRRLEIVWAGAFSAIRFILEKTEAATLTRRLCQVVSVRVKGEFEAIRQSELAKN